MPSLRSTPKPQRSLGVVGWQLAASGIKAADEGGGFGITGHGGAAQPGFANDKVARHAVAIEQRLSPAQLGRAQSAFGGSAVMLHGDAGVLGHPGAVLVQDAHQVVSQRQPRR